MAQHRAGVYGNRARQLRERAANATGGSERKHLLDLARCHQFGEEVSSWTGPSYCCFSLSRLPLGAHQPKRLGSIGMTDQIQDIAKPRLPACPWATISRKMLDFALRT